MSGLEEEECVTEEYTDPDHHDDGVAAEGDGYVEPPPYDDESYGFGDGDDISQLYNK